MDWKTKITSRKFLLALAAGLASIGGSIAGIATDNTALTTTGLVCTMISAAIYAAAEAYVDGKSVASMQTVNQIVTTKQVSATSYDNATVQAAFAPEAVEVKEGVNGTS
ncbi:MAG: hypothetical protein RSB04_11115 [Gordonibacter sp.]|uniref:hypothetical protein n=1 Tax=Gordonibacter sp. TaxID=1968902 RepID=UPI002FC83418